jgi:hypothetical protein
MEQAALCLTGAGRNKTTNKGNMKRTALLIALATTVAALTTMAQDNPSGGRPPGGGPPGGEGGRPPGGFRGGGGALMGALDLNSDGELDSREIQNAPMSLRKLDTNKDFKLTRDEIGGSRGGPGGNMADRMLEMDANKDGKLSGDEIPERMREFMDRMDVNSDGAIDKKEMEDFQTRMRERFAEGGGRGGEGQGRPPREGGNQ